MTFLFPGGGGGKSSPDDMPWPPSESSAPEGVRGWVVGRERKGDELDVFCSRPIIEIGSRENSSTIIFINDLSVKNEYSHIFAYLIC